MHSTDTCIVVANGSRARFFIVHAPDPLEGEHRRRLMETADLLNTDGRAKDEEIYAGNRPSLGHSSMGGAAHGLGGHNDEHHRLESSKRFAREIVDQLDTSCKQHGCARTIMLASHKLLGVLRPSVAKLPIQLSTHAVDLTAKSPTELDAYLVKQGILPL